MQQVFDFARSAHGPQKRKYTEEPYVEHLKRVVALVKSVSHTPAMVHASYLHDILKYTDVKLTTIKRRFGKEVAMLVDELTDSFTKEKYPELNRRWRKRKELERLAIISWDAQTIKLADIIDNLPGVVQHDPIFAKTYVAEVEAMLKVLQHGDAILRSKAESEVRLAKSKLDLLNVSDLIR